MNGIWCTAPLPGPRRFGLLRPHSSKVSEQASITREARHSLPAGRTFVRIMPRRGRTIGCPLGISQSRAHVPALRSRVLARRAARLRSVLVSPAGRMAVPELHSRLRSADRAARSPADRRARAAPVDTRRRTRSLGRVRVLRRHPPSHSAPPRQPHPPTTISDRSPVLKADEPGALSGARHANSTTRLRPDVLDGPSWQKRGAATVQHDPDDVLDHSTTRRKRGISPCPWRCCLGQRGWLSLRSIRRPRHPDG